MYIMINNGAARDFKINGRRYFMGRGKIKPTEDRELAKAMNQQRGVVVTIKDNLDKIVKIGELRSYAKKHAVSLERGDRAVDIRAKIRAAVSL